MTDHAPDDELAHRRARAIAAIAALRQQLKETARR